MSERINICIHIIFGLPGEDRKMMLETVRAVAKLAPEQVKIHLLHVIRGTALADIYLRGEYTPLTQEEYVDIVAEALTYLPPETVIGRLTGDGVQGELLAPDWSRRKTAVINDIDKKMYADGLVQGQKFLSIIQK